MWWTAPINCRGSSLFKTRALTYKANEGKIMGKFHDSLSGFDLPDEVQGVLTSAYDDDFAGASAKTDELNQTILQKDTALTEAQTKYDTDTKALKSANWDLLRSGPTAGSGNSSVDDNADELDNADVTIADLFSSPK